MDISPINDVVFKYIWYVIPIAIFTVVVKSPWFKGAVGELIVNLSAKLLLDKKRYRMINNVTLPTENGSTQIDHIIVSVYGVFVVETKNMKGWIFGSGSQKQWVQKIFKHSNSFQNPLHQNYKHVQTLQCVFWLKLDKVSRRNWTRIPFEPGHGFWLKLDKDSSANWTHQIARG